MTSPCISYNWGVQTTARLVHKSLKRVHAFVLVPGFMYYSVGFTCNCTSRIFSHAKDECSFLYQPSRIWPPFSCHYTEREHASIINIWNLSLLWGKPLESEGDSALNYNILISKHNLWNSSAPSKQMKGLFHSFPYFPLSMSHFVWFFKKKNLFSEWHCCQIHPSDDLWKSFQVASVGREKGTNLSTFSHFFFRRNTIPSII